MLRARRTHVLTALALVAITLTVLLWLRLRPETPGLPPGWAAVDHVADGDTIVLRGGATVRLVQIDTPEVYFHPECYGEQASAETKRLLRRGTVVRLVQDPATSSLDAYGRLLRYVIRRGGMNVNVRLVSDGSAAPYFFEGVRGRYAALLVRDAEAARSTGTGLWGACPGTALEPDDGVATGNPDG